MKKVIYITFEIMFVLLVISLVLILSIGIYSLTIKVVPFQQSKITDTSLAIKIYNNQGLELKEYNQFNGDKIELELLSDNTKNAFISIEDKQFYEHNGINLKRIGKAFLNNIKNFEVKEGASTITQQLIKNTHLTNDKTLTRKFNEVSLALQLEKELSKDDILENYLNIIYFGNNCYGIEEASKYYFSKSASNLTLNESAMLAGMIKSPNYYSPIKHIDRATNRKNLVLSEMKSDGKISDLDYIKEKSKPIVLKLTATKKNKLNSYSQSVIDEAVQVLKMPEKQIALGGYKIYTYQDLDKQINMQKVLQNTQIDNDYSMINIDSKTGGVLAYLGKSDYKILEHKRQVGSIIKPLFIYGPAINESIITPATLILDEPISINGYSPTNVNKKYCGYVSVRDALSKSINIPAIKTASYIGLNKIAKYAEEMNLSLDDKDYSYSLALGGLTYGYNLKELSGAYSVFTNNGNYIAPKFINYITNAKGEIVYKNNLSYKNVFRDDTAFLITDMLKTCAKSGTAKRLADLSFDVASKTGTVGNNKGNTDAYNISYTTEDIVGVWHGNMDNKLIKLVGGNQPTSIVKDYLLSIYKNNKPADFTMPNSVEQVSIDLNELENNHNLVKANSNLTKIQTKTEYFSKFNLPNECIISNINITPILTGFVENNEAKLSFKASNLLEYSLYKEINGKKTFIKKFKSVSGITNYSEIVKDNQKINYYLTVKQVGTKENTALKSNVLTLLNNSNEILKEKWYI